MLEKLKSKLYLGSVSKKEDENLFWASENCNLERLLGEQIIAILKIIDEELLISYKFGLKLQRDHVLKEKAALLSILNKFGSLALIPRRLTFEEAKKCMFDALYLIMKEEVEFYFNQVRKGGVKTAYNCHIESIASTLLHSIYNPTGKIPYI
jgi:hypothetical protein